jgi:hypothetical protein
VNAIAKRPVAQLLVVEGLPVVQGVTVVRTACCDKQLSNAVDSSPPGESDAPTFDLTSFFDDEGSQATECRCGSPLPEAKGWTP